MKKQLLLLVMMLLPMVASADAVEIEGVYYKLLGTVNGNIAEVTSNPNGYTGDLSIPAYVTSEDVQYNVTSIGENAFSGCSGLMSINLPEGLTKIGNKAFHNCKSLINIKIPNSITIIGSKSFEGCSGLISVYIGNSVNYIGASAFNDCYSLAAVHISDIEAWCKIDFNVEWLDYNNGKISNPLTRAEHLFLNGQEITELTIPNNITSIKDGVFYGWKNLSAVTIPNSVVSIGQYAFGYCGLTSIVIPNSVTIIDNNAFAYCTELSSISIGEGVTTINKNAYLWCTSLPSIILPNSLTTIGDEIFYHCISLTHIDIPDGVNNIPFRAFRDCINLKSITLPNQLLTIRDQAFRDCYGLESITIPSSTQVIYQQAFDGCSSLNQIYALPTIPPFLYDNSFPNFSAHVKVPKGCKEVYQTAQSWKNFTNISDVDKFKLTYMVDNEVYKSYEIEEGTTITPEPAPTKEGYTFSGWSEIPETMPAHDVTVTGSFFKKGDANGDNTVNAVDIVEVMNYILENPSEKFNKTASDMNNDGVVNDADIKEIVNIIMESE